MPVSPSDRSKQATERSEALGGPGSANTRAGMAFSTRGTGRQVSLSGWKRWRWRRGWGRVLLATQVLSAVLLLCREAGWLQPAELSVYDRMVVSWSRAGASD